MEKILSFDEINILAKKIANFVKENTVIALDGELGTGKTNFVKIFAKEFGIDENLKSPTFNYVLEYFDGKYPLYHFDVYRLSEASEIYEVGYEDYLNSNGVLLIEWANIIKSELPKTYIKIEFEYIFENENSENMRKINLSYVGNESLEKELLDYVNFSN